MASYIQMLEKSAMKNEVNGYGIQVVNVNIKNIFIFEKKKTFKCKSDSPFETSILISAFFSVLQGAIYLNI